MKTARLRRPAIMLTVGLGILVLAGGLVLVGGPARADGCAQGPGPQDVLNSYLENIAGQKFDRAYDLLSDAMQADSPRQDWTAAWADLFQELKIEVTGIEVGSARMESENPDDCSATAVVPNILRARDSYNSTGSVEYEYYTLVRSAGVWKVDRQHLMDESDIAKWFPDTAAD